MAERDDELEQLVSGMRGDVLSDDEVQRVALGLAPLLGTVGGGGGGASDAGSGGAALPQGGAPIVVGGGAVQATAASKVLHSLALKALLGLVTAGAITLGAVATRAPTPTGPAAGPREQVGVAPPPQSPPRAEVATGDAASEQGAALDDGAGEPRERSARRARDKRATDEDRVLLEHHLLAEARAVLGSNPERALSLTEDHSKRFARGVLAQEREIIAIEALSSLGRIPEARTRAARFGKSYPSSYFLRRLEQRGLPSTP